MESLKALEKMLLDFIISANGLIWGNFVVYFLIGAGLLFSLRSFCPQLRHFGRMFVSLKESLYGQGITGFKALSLAVGGQIGMGNIAGVAFAITAGGPGAIFWMWVTAVLGMSLILGETLLAQIYRRKDEKLGTYVAGPAFYIERGLGQRWLAILFALSMIFGFALSLSMVQSNGVTGGFNIVFGENKALFGVMIMVFTEIVILGNLKRVASVASAVVPVMSLGYILVGLYVIFSHISEVPAMFALIFKSAFGLQAVAGGILGHSVREAMRHGCARGLFSNEAGWGTTPHAHGTAEVNHPMDQGMTAMFGVFLDTILVCTVTAVVILLSGQADSGASGLELTRISFESLLGPGSSYFLALAIVLFAWTSLIGVIFYGEVNVRYLFPNNRTIVTVYRYCAGPVIFIGAVTSIPLIWEFADFCSAITMFINVVCLFLMSGLAIKVMKDYEAQRARGIAQPIWDRNSVKIPERGRPEIM